MAIIFISPRTVRIILFIAFLIGIPMTSHATQEPDYKVVLQLDAIEVREYAGYTVAEVVVPGPAKDAGNAAFPILAGYIFGKNKGERKLAMTAPVTQSSAPGGFRVQFVLPKGTTMANAPEPLDPRITLRDVAPSKVAVIRFSGFWSDDNYNEHLAKLQAALRAEHLVSVGEPVYSRYDAPFTPWFMRRNEIWLHLSGAPK